MPVRELNPKRTTTTRDPRRELRSDFIALNPMQQLQQRIGNHATGLLLQTKLRVGAPNDRYEQEADQVADVVMRTADPTQREIGAAPAGPILQLCSCGGTCASCAANEEEHVLQRCSCGGSCASCAAHADERRELMLQPLAISAGPQESIQRDSSDTCETKDEVAEPEETAEETEEKKVTGEEEAAGTADEGDTEQEAESHEEQEGEFEKTVQPKRFGAAAASPDDVEDRLTATRGRGSPLPHDARSLMESRFGQDFSNVRVHTGTDAHGLNRDLNALAFTTGRDIYFGPGQYQPATRGGQHLLAHELAHVVQQGGGAGNGIVREKADPHLISRKRPEFKPYYLRTVSGVFVHYRIEKILRDADDQLVTEAAIPGANRFSPALNKVGRADLYKSNPAKTVSGVKGLRDVATGSDVITMDSPTSKSVNTNPAVTSSPTVSGPVKDPNRTWHGKFPTDIQLGEIKPLATSKLSAGILQLDSYERGYKAFVTRIHAISGSTGATIGITRLAIRLPAFLDFNNWATEHAREAPQSTVGTRRLWVADVGNGLYLYFDLDKGLTGAPETWKSQQVSELKKIKDALATPHPKTTDEKLESLAVVAGKFRPGGPPAAFTVQRKARDTTPRIVQRSTKDRPPGYWSARAKEWEEMRFKWAKPFRRALKTEHKAWRDKARAEKKLARTGRGAPAAEQTEVREYSQLMFWSGLLGRFLGKVRFLLGTVWDKILGIFEKMKEKMHGVRSKVNEIKESSWFSTGWRKTLIKILMKVAKVVLIKFVTESFNFFVECFHSAMDKVVAKIQAELSEKFAVELCKARKFFEDSKKTLEDEWGVSLTDLQTLIDTVQNIRHWTDILTSLIQLIRLGVQVISCLTPPALGCLWGLIAQIGIEAGLDLIIGTQWFNDRIVTPTIRDLVRTYATPLYQRLINRALGENLKEYHCDLAGAPTAQVEVAAGDGLKEGSAELKAHRDQWEVANQDTMMKDLQVVFQKGKGKKVTPEEMQRLAEELKKQMAAGKTPEQIKTLLEASRDPLNGKLTLDVAMANVQAGALPEAKEEGKGEGEVAKRKIDYPKATKRNRELKKSLGWDPFTFVKKPGIQADSEEFADAVYDLQLALHVDADGILGQETLIAFYDRNKLKHDKAYDAAVERREELKARHEKEKAEKAEKAAKEKAAKEGKGVTKGGGEIVAIGVVKPADSASIIENRYPNEYWAYRGGWITLPFGTATPELAPGSTYTPGQLLTVSMRYYLKSEQSYVWFVDIPAQCVTMSAPPSDDRVVTFDVSNDFYFKVAVDSPRTYHVERGRHAIALDREGFGLVPI